MSLKNWKTFKKVSRLHPYDSPLKRLHGRPRCLSVGLLYPALQPLPESKDAHCPILCKPAWLRGSVEFSLLLDHWNRLSLGSHRDERVPLENLEFNKVFHLWLCFWLFQKISCDVLFLALGISDFSTTGIGWGHRVLLLPFWLLHSWAFVAGFLNCW